MKTRIRNERKKETDRQWYLRNKEHAKKLSAQYQKDNPERTAKSAKKWRDKVKDTPEYKERRGNSRKKWYSKNKHIVLAKKYGVDPEVILALPKSCEMCGSEEKLVVDHCHKTDKVRGTLCTYCNLTLGNAKDSIEVLKKAIKYLEKHV